jgi:hypothetical protein
VPSFTRRHSSPSKQSRAPPTSRGGDDDDGDDGGDDGGGGGAPPSVIGTAGTAVAMPAKGAALVKPANPNDAARIVATANSDFVGKRFLFSPC